MVVGGGRGVGGGGGGGQQAYRRDKTEEGNSTCRAPPGCYVKVTQRDGQKAVSINGSTRHFNQAEPSAT